MTWTKKRAEDLAPGDVVLVDTRDVAGVVPMLVIFIQTLIESRNILLACEADYWEWHIFLPPHAMVAYRSS